MPDDTNTNTDTNNDASNQQQGSTQGSGGGHVFAFGMDSNAQSDMGNVEKMKATLEACGNKVYFTQIGPNQETYLANKAKEVNADVCIFACLVAPATIWSFGNAVKAGTLPHTIFAIEGWMAKAKSLEDVMNTPWDPEHDAGQFMTGSSTSKMKAEASTVGDWVNENSEYISICYGSSAEELAQNICDGMCGKGGGNSSTVSGGAQIKDKTFEHCIRRICAATDSVFLVENNAAILFPYTDWMAFTLRQKIQAITADQIDPDLFSIEYNNEGFYNKVTTVYGADEEADKQIDQEEQKITTGNTTQTRKSMPTGGTQISEQYDPLVRIYGTLEKKVTTNFENEETAQYVANALLIQYIRDFNNSCRVRTLYHNNCIGGTFYSVQNPFTKVSDLFYLNSYVIYKEKDKPITVDREFKYGPEGAEEILDYQHYSGGGSTQNSMGSSTESEIWAHASKFCHQWTCENIREAESDATDPQIAEDYVNKCEQEGREKICLSCYGMSSWLYYQFNYKANIPCQVVGDSSHHVVMLDRGNGFVETRNEYKQLEEGYHWKGNQNTTVLLPASNSPGSSASGDTSNG